MGRLDTCYAPVRRSPSEIASYLNAAPRLACVKPVASVHPEPGSNSSLYSISKYLDTVRASVVAQHNPSKLGPAFAPGNLVEYLDSFFPCFV